MQSVANITSDFLQRGALAAALRVRWFETTLERLTDDERCEMMMTFLVCGSFKIKGE